MGLASGTGLQFNVDTVFVGLGGLVLVDEGRQAAVALLVGVLGQFHGLVLFLLIFVDGAERLALGGLVLVEVVEFWFVVLLGAAEREARDADGQLTRSVFVGLKYEEVNC